jgi:DNA-binding protein Fis
MSPLEQQAYQATRELLAEGNLHIWYTIIRQAEVGMLKAALELTDGNQTEAAFILQKNRCTVRTRMEQYQLN